METPFYQRDVEERWWQEQMFAWMGKVIEMDEGFASQKAG